MHLPSQQQPAAARRPDLCLVMPFRTVKWYLSLLERARFCFLFVVSLCFFSPFSLCLPCARSSTSTVLQRIAGAALRLGWQPAR
jgi:hypothetical protein